MNSNDHAEDRELVPVRINRTPERQPAPEQPVSRDVPRRWQV